MQNRKNFPWWNFLIRGLLALTFSFISLTNAGATALAIFVWFVLYAVVDGLFHIYMSIVYRHDSDRWWLGLVSGLLSVAVGGLALFWPQLTAYILLLFIALRAIIDGGLRVLTALRVGRQVQGEWLLVVSGLLGIGFGVWMLLQPVIGGLALLWVIALYALALGFIWIAQALRLRFGAAESAP
jgi:uncharacterized membrane protein HdeD (DUF308 family)